MGAHFATQLTPGGYLAGEVSSALQKSIRRGLEREVPYWATELDLAGFGNYVFKRLRIIASEDVEPADSMVAVQVRSLYENWLEARKRKPKDQQFAVGERLFLLHAVIILARAAGPVRPRQPDARPVPAPPRSVEHPARGSSSLLRHARDHRQVRGQDSSSGMRQYRGKDARQTTHLAWRALRRSVRTPQRTHKGYGRSVHEVTFPNAGPCKSATT
jgi:hypothetical protein